MRRSVLAAVLAAPVAACGHSDPYIFTKPDTSWAQTQAEGKSCSELGRAATSVPAFGGLPPTSPANMVLGGIAAGFDRAHQSTMNAWSCMKTKGYRVRYLTPEEERAFDAASTPEAREAFVRMLKPELPPEKPQ